MPAALSCLARLLRLLCATAALLGAAQGWAQSCTATVTDIDFGAPAPQAGLSVDATGTVRIHCTGITFLTAIKVCPNLGYGSGGGTATTRQLTGPGGAGLSFQLYQDAARTVPWGALHAPQLGTVPAILLQPGLQGAAAASVPLYARLFLQADAPPGSYASSFAGAAAAFTYSRVLLGQLTGCLGFVGSEVIQPEFTVRGSLRATCSVAAGDLAFPPTGILATALQSQSNLWVTCTPGTSFAVSLDNGRIGSVPEQRRMASAAGATVSYGLFRDPARTLLWGGREQGLAAAATGTGQPQNLIVYGRVPPQAAPAPGIYVDRVVVTVSY